MQLPYALGQPEECSPLQNTSSSRQISLTVSSVPTKSRSSSSTLASVAPRSPSSSATPSISDSRKPKSGPSTAPSGPSRPRGPLGPASPAFPCGPVSARRVMLEPIAALSAQTPTIVQIARRRETSSVCIEQARLLGGQLLVVE